MSRIGKLGHCFTGAALTLVSIVGSLGCGSGSGKASPPIITVTLSPSPTASMNLGSTLQFNASVTQNKTVISTPITFLSSNKAILSFSPSGLACAGSWGPNFIVCNPGIPGVVTTRASGYGTPSPMTVVYVHPAVTNIVASSVDASPPTCVPQKQTENFQAAVLSGSTDITQFVGPLTWSVIDGRVATVSTTATGLRSNQVQVTAAQPGLTHIFANVSGINGQSAPFETCPVQSISLVASSTGSDSLSLASGSSSTLVPTVTDSQGNAITVSGLTWLSSQPGVANAKTSSVTAVSPGGAAVFPVCAPPTCNVNLSAVYSGNVVRTTVTGSAVANTVYVASTGCYAVANCNASLIPINTQNNTAGTAIALPSPPNSMIMDPTGAHVYFGTGAGLRIMATAGNTFTGMNNVTGKALAASPDGTMAIVSDTTASPNVVFIVNSKASTSTPLLLSGVTAAAFSPDSRSAYLLAGSKLYVYSTTHALQTITLPGAASDAAFLTTGAFGFVSSAPSTVSLFNGCDNAAPQSPNTSTVTTLAPPLLAAIPDGKTIAAITSDAVTTIAVSTTAAGCPPPVTATATTHGLGQGPFTPTQVLVSSDGARVYVVSNLNSVTVYDIATNSVRAIALNPSATPLSATPTLSGQDMYVGASDGTVHHLDAASNFADLGQIPVSLCSNTSASCPPNLVALRP
jgi:hypothetical protein